MIEIPMPPEGIDCTVRADYSSFWKELAEFVEPFPEKFIEFYNSPEGTALWNSKELLVCGRGRLEAADEASEPVLVLSVHLRVDVLREALRAREG